MEQSIKVSLADTSSIVKLTDNISLSITVEGNVSQDEPVELEIKFSAPEKKTDTPITLHSGCKPGDCVDCHVVSCPVYLGYETL